MEIIVIAALAFGFCFAVDKLYTRLFRNRAQHRSGKSVRHNKRYATIGLVLAVIGIAGLMTGIGGNTAMVVGGCIVLLLGVGLIVYYLSSGIYYDEAGFLVESFGKRSVCYGYEQILHQQLYTLQGGGIIVELHMENGEAVQVVSNMPEYDRFLTFAFRQWCSRKGVEPESCSFHDPETGRWFPAKEEI